MFPRGTRSWRFGHGTDLTPHALLFIRDCLGLPAGTGPESPPRLAGEVPDLTGRLDERTRREAGEQWPAWWLDVVTRETTMRLEDRGTDFPVPSAQMAALRVRDWMRGRGTLIDPPEWASLRDRPALQAAVRACYIDGCRWAGAATAPPQSRGESAAMFEWHVVRDAAEATAAELGVDIGDVDGRAVVIAVAGHWHELFAPGVVVCSVSDASDPQVAPVILREVFRSWATRGVR